MTEETVPVKKLTPIEEFLVGYAELVKRTKCAWATKPVWILRDDQSWSTTLKMDAVELPPSQDQNK